MNFIYHNIYYSIYYYYYYYITSIMINNSDDISEWVYIKTKSNKKKQNRIIYNPTLDELKIGIIKILKYYNPYAIYLYGSRVRKTNRIDSDIDILVIWNIEPLDLKNIKQDIIDEIKIKVDFVNLVYTDSKKIILSDNDILYYENVLLDAINIYTRDNKNKYLEDIILYSIKLPKI